MSTNSALGKSKFLEVADGTGSRKLHYCEAGSGPVTVLFEAGLGKSRSTWALVQPTIARHARTVVYDRAGHGRSDLAQRPRTFGALLDDHLRLLDDVVDDRCIIVGHSYGGPIARQAAAARPDKVLGVVLVDEVPEMCGAALLGKGMTGAGVLYGLSLLLGRLGLLGAALRRTYFKQLEGSALDEAVTEGGSVASARAARDEWNHMIAGLHDLESSGPHVPNSYVSEISALRATTPETLSNDFLYHGHRETVAAAPSGRHVMASKPGHYVQMTDPDVVVAEIVEALRQVSTIH